MVGKLMQHYDLKLFGRPGGCDSRISMGAFPFWADDNLSAVRQAQTALSEALPGCDYAVLRQDGVGVIWEDYTDPPIPGGVSA